MSGLFEVFGVLLKRLLVACFVVGGLMLGMFVATGTLLAISVVQFVRRLRGPRAQPTAQQGNVFEGEYSVVKPSNDRATILMVQQPSKPSADLP